MNIPNSLSQADRRTAAEINAYIETIPAVISFLARGPNAGGQEKFFYSKKHQIIQAGGNKSGKTWSSVMKGALRSVPEKDIKGQNTGWLIDPYLRLRLPQNTIQAWISTYSQPVQQETVQPVVEEIFRPYITNEYKEKGCLHWIETDHARINFKWQTAEQSSYTGANLNWAMLDEPHDRQRYYEVVSRFVQTKGYMWMALTPVIDAKDPDIGRKMRYIRWLKEELIDAFEEDPKTVPQVDVIYVDTEENPHVEDIQFVMDMWASMSDEEKLIRKTGRFFDFIGESCFSQEHLVKLEAYLRNNPEVSQPEYGYLEYDDRETDDDWKIVFVRGARDFPYEPVSGWMWKIWEEPVKPQLGIAPTYSIGVDPAEGKRGKDYTAVYIERDDTGQVVAALHGYIDEIELARQLWLAGHYYCERTGYIDDAVMGRKPAKLAVETVSIGKTAVAYLMTGHDELGIGKYGIENLYRMPDKRQLASGRPTPGRDVGWYTSASSRDHLITAMRTKLANSCAAIEAGDVPLIPDIGWVREAGKFILHFSTSSARYEAAPGFYDDRLFAAAICDKVVEQSQGRRRPLGRHPEEPLPKELYYIKDGNYVFNPVEAKARSRKSRQPQELWY